MFFLCSTHSPESRRPSNTGSDWRGTPFHIHSSDLLNGLPISCIRALCGILMFLSTNPQTLSQTHVSFDRYSVEQGLPSTTVDAILHDSHGFMWFGTLDGLARFDGYECTTFRHKPEDTTTLSDNVIWSLLEDTSGNIWVGTFNGGLNRYDRATGRFERFVHNPSDATSLTHNTVRVMLEDTLGNLWIGTFGGGLDKLERPQMTFAHFHHTPGDSNSLSNDFIRSLCEVSPGILWVGTSKGLNIIDTRTMRVTRPAFHTTESARLLNDPIRSLKTDKAGNIWIGTARGVIKADHNARVIECFESTPSNPHSLSHNTIISVLETGDGLWVGTGSGLNKVDPSNGRFTRIRHHADDETSLSDDNIRSMYRDRLGGIWVGTYSGGVNKINSQRKKFRLFRFADAFPNEGSAGDIWSLAEDDAGSLWIGTAQGGLWKLDRQTFQAKAFRHDSHDPGSLPANSISAMCVDGSGELWIGTWGAGLARLNKARTRFARIHNHPGTPGDNQVNVIFEDGNGTIWVGTSGGGLARFHRSSGTFSRFVHEPDNPWSISNNRIKAIKEDLSGNLWVGTEGGGACRFEASTGRFHRYRYSSDERSGLSNDRVYAIAQDSLGTMWFGTASGLNRFDPSTGVFRRYSMKDGLPSDYIRAIVVDERGRLWISTTNGLSRFDPRTDTFRNYDISDGLQGNAFSDACFRNKRGEIILGGSSGISLFHPDSIMDNPFIPPIVVTQVTLFEKAIDLGGFSRSDGRIMFSYEQNFLAFTFSALDYTYPGKNRYRYMLEGLDRDWIDAGTRRYAPYPKLSPGEYTFRVQGSNSDERWNRAGASLPFVITPPFWETWWFRLVALTALIAALAAAYNYRVAQLLKIERMRVRIASDLHDEIGSSLSSIALITDMVRKRLPTEEQEHRHLTDASIAARHTADSLRDIVWMLNPDHEKFEDIILRMKDTAKKLLVGIDYSFTTGTVTAETILGMEFRRHVLMIYKEILNNIAKHAKATTVDIKVRDTDGIMHLVIADNGVGFDEATINKGNGLNNLRQRAKEISGEIDIASKPGVGTTITLSARIT